MALKHYELLPNMDAAAPVYQTLPDGKREQIKKIPFYRPTLRQTFQDEKWRSKTIRYKATSSTIDQKEQIEVEKILANEPFSTQEYNDLMFRFASLSTDNLTAQEYLEAHPDFLGFKGKRPAEIREARYKLVDEVADAEEKNDDSWKRFDAMLKIRGLNLEQLQSLMLRLNGYAFKTPNTVKECQNGLIEFIDDAGEKELDALFKEEGETTVDENMTILIGKLLNAELLSFDAVQGKISKKDKDGKWITIREMSTEYSLEERMRLFSDFLNTEDGKPLKIDLENSLNGSSEESKKMGRPKSK
jgi:hypothetical protein